MPAPRSCGVDECLGFLEADPLEDTGGVELVAGLEVLELAVHGGVEELDDRPAVVGLFENDLPE